MKKIFLIFLLSLFLFYSGCATIFQGSKDEINMSSEPSGAKILVNGHDVGKTPMEVTFKRGQEYYVEFVKQGYEKMGIKLSYGIGAGWIILDILSGLVGIIIDAVTENWYGFDLESYKANLEPEAK